MKPLGGREQLLDVMLGAVLAAIGVASVLSPAPAAGYDFPPPNAALVVLALVAAGLLTVRRRWPLTVCVLVMSTVFVIGVMSWNAGDTPFFIMIGLYTVAAQRELPAALAGLGFVYACITVLLLLQVAYFDDPVALLFVVAVSAAWALGRGMRHRRRQQEDAVAFALRAERARAVEAERAVLAERLHIARELHDVVSHTLSVIAVQSGTARHRLEHEPDGAAGRSASVLSAIETESRTALDDLRRMLGLLRAESGDAAMPHGGDETGLPGDGSTSAPAREWIVDTTVALVLTALGLGLAFVDDPARAYDYSAPNAVFVLLVMAACLPLAVRQRWPAAVFAASVVATAGTIVGGWDQNIPAFAAYVGLYTVAAWRPFWVAAGCLAVWVAGNGMLWIFPAPHYDPFADLGGAGVLVPWVLGIVVQRWRRERDVALARALEAERTQTVAAERAVYAERLRIAGELHDVIAHTLSTVAVQAAVMRHELAGSPGPDAMVLSTIEQASRAALDDLRRMLGVLRDSSDRDRASLTPTPGLDELELVASAHRAAHGPLELTVDPVVRTAPESVQLTVLRIVQEALTNMRKHAPGATGRVRVSAESDAVVVVVEDDGSAVADAVPIPAGGYGLVGMQERVALFGGDVDAGPLGDGGFRVRATLLVQTGHAVAV